jgi:uncharacterized protein
MSTPAAILREIHRLRRHAADLQARIDQGPRQTKAQHAKVARQEETLQQAHEALKKLKVTMHEKEVSLKATQQQIAKYEKQLNEAASKKEYDALKTEIAAARQKVRQLEDEILDAMGESEERTARLPEEEKALRQAKEEVLQYERDSAQRLAGYATQRDEALRQLAAVEATLPPDMRAQYDRLVAAHGADALSAVQNRTCVACYTEITAQMYNELMRGMFVPCKSCGRMLYLPE